MLNRNDVAIVNFVVKLPEFITYEFETEEYYPFGEDKEGEYCLFRLFINADGSEEILIANDEDYDIHEDATEHFDVQSIKLLCLESDVEDITQTYIDHYKQREEWEHEHSNR